MSLSFWTKDLYDGHVFHAIRTEDNGPAFTLSVVDGQLKFVVTRYNFGWQFSSCNSFTHNALNGWHMITIVSDFNQTTLSTITTRLYIDGVFVDLITEGDNVYGESEGGCGQKNYRACSKFIIGGALNANYGPKLNASRLTIDNLRFYKYRCLTDDEVKSIYNIERRRKK